MICIRRTTLPSIRVLFRYCPGLLGNLFWNVRLWGSLTLLSAGTPMFFMGEEIGASKLFTYNNFQENREDLLGDTISVGARLFATTRT